MAYIKKLENTVEVGILVNNETVSSTKDVVGRKKVDVSIKKVICITG